MNDFYDWKNSVIENLCVIASMDEVSAECLIEENSFLVTNGFSKKMKSEDMAKKISQNRNSAIIH